MIAALGCVAALLVVAMAVQLAASRRCAWKLHDTASTIVWVLVAVSGALIAAAVIGGPS